MWLIFVALKWNLCVNCGCVSLMFSACCRCDQSCAAIGDQVFMFGGFAAGGDFCKDLYVLHTGEYLMGNVSQSTDPPTYRPLHTRVVSHQQLQHHWPITPQLVGMSLETFKMDSLALFQLIQLFIIKTLADFMVTVTNVCFVLFLRKSDVA